MTLAVETLDTHAPRIARARIDFARIKEKTIPLRLAAQQPLKLLSPKNHGHAAWVYSSSFGGGLLAGDHIALTATLAKNTTALFSTQSSTKIYLSPDERISCQSLRVTLDENSTFILWPDPLVPFAGSRYSQHQTFHLAQTANLVLLDWYTSGRHARGERWHAASFESRNEIQAGDKIIARDVIRITPTHPALFGSFDCFATLFLVGPALVETARKLVEEIRHEPITKNAPLIFSASPLGSGALLRIAGKSTEQVSHFLQSKCPVVPQLLGDNPWTRKR